MSLINRRSPIPLYHQLAKILRAEIVSGTVNPGQPLPSERELIKTYGLSRNTVRLAIDALITEGLVHREHGRGSYVIRESLSIQCKLDTFVEHHATLRGAGYEPTVRHISTKRQLADAVVRAALRLAEGEQVICFAKLFLADNRPAILTYDHLPVKAIGDCVNETGSGQAFFDFLENQCGMRPEFILADVIPAKAEGEIARHFACPEGTLLLLLQELFLDPSQHTPLAFAYNYYHPEIVHFKILRRWQNSALAP